jgi:hypothetical protein
MVYGNYPFQAGAHFIEHQLCGFFDTTGGRLVHAIVNRRIHRPKIQFQRLDVMAQQPIKTK